MSDQRLTDEDLSDIERRFGNAQGDMRSWGPVTLFHAAREVPRLLAELRRTRAELAAIVAIHQPTAMNSWGHRTCTHCDTPGYYQEWPCPTLVALGFEEQ